MKIPLFVLLLTVSLCGPVAASCPQGDLNGDCQVNLEDLMIFSEQWLDDTGCSGFGCADLDDINGVNMSDFALLAENWYKTGTHLVISEFMASNGSTLEDEDGDFPDWLEIYNPSCAEANLDGWYLTDDSDELTRWQFPAVTLDAGEFLVVFASGKGRSDDPNELHTNFNLDKDGEYLALVEADGTTISSEYNEFPQQFRDVSYGLSSQDKLQYFETPTPGSENGIGFDGYAESAEFSREAGVFVSAFSLELTVDSPQAQIRYTTNGSEPTEASTLYSTPIYISTTKEVRAKVYEPNLIASEIESKGYIALDTDVQDFNSNLPIVVIDSFGFDIDTEHDPYTYYPYRPVTSAFIDTDRTTGRATITDLPDFAGRAGLKVRGDSSAADWMAASWARQYSFETWDEEDDDKNVSILGFPKESDWILHIPFDDKSLMRNVLAYKWSNDMGHWAARTRFVELFLNKDGDDVSMDDYWGIYIFMEKIRVDDNRADIARLEPADDAEPEISGGYIIKHDKNSLFDETFTTDLNKTGEFQYQDPRSDELTSQQKAWIKGYLDQLETALYGDSYTDPVNGYAKYMDINTFIDFFWIVEITKQVDSYVFSTYMYKDRNGKLKMGPVWDFNIAFGNAGPTPGQPWYFDWQRETQGWYYVGLGGGSGTNVWYNRLRQDAEYNLKCADRWFELRESRFSDANINADLDYYYNLLSVEAAARHFTRWQFYVDPDTGMEVESGGVWASILNAWTWPNWYYGTPNHPHTYQMEVEWIKNWLTGEGTPAPGETYDPDYTDRVGWIDTNIAYAAPPVFYINDEPQNTNSYVEAGDVLTMSAPSGTIYYTLDGNDPRLLGGAVNPNAIEFFPASGQTQASFISQGATWKYLDNGSNQGTSWREAAFDDDSWASGLAELGYGDGDEATVVSYGGDPQNKYITTYFRHTFNVDDASEVNDLTLEILRDDGAVFYLKGTEIDRDNMPAGTITYLTTAIEYTPYESTFFEFPVDANGLVDGNNVIAVEIHQDSKTSSDISFDFKLYGTISVSPSSPIALTETTCIKARSLNGSNWSALNEAIFAIGPVAENLRITEIMYHPAEPPEGDPNAEFIELKNIGPNTLNLNLVSFTKGIYFTFQELELEAGEYVVVVKDQAVFEAQYVEGINIAGEYDGRLDNGGEQIRLEDAIGQRILDFEYNDNWRPITDGVGFSLTIVDPTNSDPNSWGEKAAWRASTFVGGSPGEDDQGPNPGDVVINEVLAHSHLTPDWIELHNTTGESVNIGGWFLSDNGSDDANLMKYEIADGITIGANDYIVFYEDSNFGNPNDAGCNRPFALSENGETVYLSSGQAGVLTGYRQQEDFGASETGVAFGRYLKSTGTYNFVAMSSNTPGWANAYPKVGPIVINEMMYNPESGNQNEEYLELYNITGTDVNLYDEEGIPWKFTDGIEFTFPSDANIPAYGYLMVVKDPAAFESLYGTMPPGIEVFGPYDGQLRNSGEKVEISMPGDEEDGTRYYIRIDRVNYSDGSHPENCPGGVDLWPTEPDGGGASLSRIFTQYYGNDPNNWEPAEPPTPGE